jgi:hypothetical protein
MCQSLAQASVLYGFLGKLARFEGNRKHTQTSPGVHKVYHILIGERNHVRTNGDSNSKIKDKTLGEQEEFKVGKLNTQN